MYPAVAATLSARGKVSCGRGGLVVGMCLVGCCGFADHKGGHQVRRSPAQGSRWKGGNVVALLDFGGLGHHIIGEGSDLGFELEMF